MYEIYTNGKPFDGCNVFQIPLKLKERYRPTFDTEIPQSYKDLIIRCWRENPADRPSFDQILNDLKNDRGFITEKVNEEEYFNYVKFIDEQQKTFESSKIIDIRVIFNRANIVESINFQKREKLSLFFPYTDFLQLKEEESIKLVEEAEKDSNKMFHLAQCLINGEFDFSKKRSTWNKIFEKIDIKHFQSLLERVTYLFHTYFD